MLKYFSARKLLANSDSNNQFIRLEGFNFNYLFKFLEAYSSNVQLTVK